MCRLKREIFAFFTIVFFFTTYRAFSQQTNYGVLVTERFGDYNEKVTFHSTRAVPAGTMFYKEFEFSTSTEQGFAEIKTWPALFIYQVTRDLSETETFSVPVWEGKMGILTNSTKPVKVTVFSYNPREKSITFQVGDFTNVGDNAVERLAHFEKDPVVNSDGSIEVKLDKFNGNTTFLLDKCVLPKESVQDKGGGNYTITPPFKVSPNDHLLTVGTNGGSDTISFRYSIK